MMTYDRVPGFTSYWNDFENFSSERPVAYFLTSGSTGDPKRVPVTPSLIRQKSEAIGVYWDAVYKDHPILRNGNFIANFADSGYSHRSESGIPELSETTFWNQRMQGFQRRDRWPLGRDLTQIDDAELRYFAAARLSLQGQLHCMMSLNPSTLVKFCQTIVQYAAALESGLANGDWGLGDLDSSTSLPTTLNDRLSRNQGAANRVAKVADAQQKDMQLMELWPDIELVISWRSDGVRPYTRLLARNTAGVNWRDYISQSSECILCIPVEDGVPGGLLAYNSHFYEFIPEEATSSDSPDTLLASEIEIGGRYEVVVTTGGGLYRYRTGDCLKVDGYRSGIPWLSFQYRLGKTSSITGEKLTEAQVIEALRLAEVTGIIQSTRAIVYPRTSELPHYGIMLPASALEPNADAAGISQWVATVDNELARLNGEYNDKRESGRLGPMVCAVVEDANFARIAERSRRRHVGDEQFKPDILTRDPDLDRGLSATRYFNASL